MVDHFLWLQLSPAGGRLIIASDGVWDAVSTKKAARCCRGVSQPEIAAKYVVKVVFLYLLFSFHSFFLFSFANDQQSCIRLTKEILSYTIRVGFSFTMKPKSLFSVTALNILESWAF